MAKMKFFPEKKKVYVSEYSYFFNPDAIVL